MITEYFSSFNGTSVPKWNFWTSRNSIVANGSMHEIGLKEDGIPVDLVLKMTRYGVDSLEGNRDLQGVAVC